MTRLSLRSRVLTALAVVLLLIVYAVPLWRIDLLAPQYPEGLGMLIRVNTITGVAPSDLGNINGLNHYIGMKAIVPEAIPVLRYMPWVLGALALGGVVVAGWGRRGPLLAWLAAFGVAGVAGLIEFHRWSYDYGHNLAADAVIKVPGMSYQPPLIGSKQLLNFTASSWPDVGGWLAGIAFVLGVAALLPLHLRTRRMPLKTDSLARAAVAIVATLVLGAAACARTSGPVPIAYGAADCDVCRMRITDERYGGEFVTRTGKVHQFDSIECLARYVSTTPDAGASGFAYVSDFERPGHLLPVARALFVQRGAGGSPMAAGLLAVGPAVDTADAQARFGGRTLTWQQVVEQAARGALRQVPSAPVAGAGA